MNEEIKVKFIDALLSGLYEQVAGQMRTADGRVCANGILCELAIQDHVIGIRYNDSVTGDGYRTYNLMTPARFCDDGAALSESWKNDYPPESVLKWAGVNYNWANQLASLNDNGRTFEDIAEIIKNGGLPNTPVADDDE